jgi:hypothetical protein
MIDPPMTTAAEVDAHLAKVTSSKSCDIDFIINASDKIADPELLLRLLAALRDRTHYRSLAIRLAVRGSEVVPVLAAGLGNERPDAAIALGIMGDEADRNLARLDSGQWSALATERLRLLQTLPPAPNARAHGRCSAHRVYKWPWAKPPEALPTIRETRCITTLKPHRNVWVRLEGPVSGTVVELRPDLVARIHAKGVEVLLGGAAIKQAEFDLAGEGWVVLTLSGAGCSIESHRSPPYFRASDPRGEGAVRVTLGDDRVQVRIEEDGDDDVEFLTPRLFGPDVNENKRALRELRSIDLPEAKRVLRVSVLFSAAPAARKKKPAARAGTLEQAAEELGLKPTRQKGRLRKGKGAKALDLLLDAPALRDLGALQDWAMAAVPERLALLDPNDDGRGLDQYGAETKGSHWLSLCDRTGNPVYLYVSTEHQGQAVLLRGLPDSVEGMAEKLLGLEAPLDAEWKKL